MDNNETFYLKIAGKVNIPTRLEIGHNYKLVADCSITSETRIDNDNGEFDVVFKVEPITCEISKDNGAVIKAKDPRKNSQKFRNYLYKLWMEDGCIYPFDEIYEQVIYDAMAITPNLLRTIIKRMDEK
jgi:hypothetical protein